MSRHNQTHSSSQMCSPLLASVPQLPPCDSPIWGQGQVLEQVQMAKIFPDSKTFVDLRLLHPEDKIMANFKAIPTQPTPTPEDLRNFVTSNFSLTKDLEFEDWDPEDWTPEPAYIAGLKRKPLLYVGREVNKLWKDLSRKSSQDLVEHPDLFSTFPLPYGFIMPGGRFREIYYWDTYWILRACLISDMVDTAKGIIKNFVHQVDMFGHVPNGTRAYYERRTQPPFLTSMVSKLMEKTNDLDFLAEVIRPLEKELQFYELNRAVDLEWEGKNYVVFHYSADCRGPRPESYSEDVEIAESLFHTEAEREEFYLHMKAAAESGWDFSSRWFINKEGANNGTLADAKTCYIAPVDLNSLMYKNYHHLQLFHKALGNTEKASMYKAKAKRMLEAMNELFWCEEDGTWYDIDMLNGKRRKYFYGSNFFPLWAQAYSKKDADKVALASVKYLHHSGALAHDGGIPASLEKSGQQWDYNAWPPLQHIIVAGLNKTENPKAMMLAFKIAKKYVLSCIASCNKEDGTCKMFEKYDPLRPGKAGGGGEYEVQLGFGWTNGVLIDFITIYGDALLEDEEHLSSKMHGKKYGLEKKQEYVGNIQNKVLHDAQDDDDSSDED